MPMLSFTINALFSNLVIILETLAFDKSRLLQIATCVNPGLVAISIKTLISVSFKIEDNFS